MGSNPPAHCILATWAFSLDTIRGGLQDNVGFSVRHQVGSCQRNLLYRGNWRDLCLADWRKVTILFARCPLFLIFHFILWASIFIWPDREGHLLFVTEAGSSIREDLVRPEKQFYNKNKTLEKHFNVGGTSLCSWQSTFIQTMGLTRISAELCLGKF